MVVNDAMETLIQRDQNTDTKRSAVVPDQIGAGAARVLRRSISVCNS
jgi:hypothetical protein